MSTTTAPSIAVAQWANAFFYKAGHSSASLQINSATSELPGSSHHLGLLSQPLQKHLPWLQPGPSLRELSSVSSWELPNMPASILVDFSPNHLLPWELKPICSMADFSMLEKEECLSHELLQVTHWHSNWQLRDSDKAHCKVALSDCHSSFHPHMIPLLVTG